MPALKNKEDLQRLRVSAQAVLEERTTSGATIYIGMGTCGIAAGASHVDKAVQTELAKQSLEAQVIHVGCIGMCVKEPLVDIQLPNKPRVTYANVSPGRIPRLIEEHLIHGQVVQEWAVGYVPTDW